MPCYIVNSHDGLDAVRQDELCMALIQVSARLNPVQLQRLPGQPLHTFRVHRACR